MTEENFTTIRILRTVRHDIERIASKHQLDTGEKLDAGQVVEKAIRFLKEIVFDGEKESEQA